MGISFLFMPPESFLFQAKANKVVTFAGGSTEARVSGRTGTQTTRAGGVRRESQSEASIRVT